MTQLLSPRQVAQAIGVSESSLKRWVDDGALRAVRTTGGHRRIPLAEAIRFIRATGSTVVQPAVLGLTDLRGVSDHMPAQADEANWLYEMLVDGREREARGFLISLYLAGRSIEAICDGPLQHAMSRLGELWKHGTEGIFIEHRAADICLQSLHQLQNMLTVPVDAPVAVGGGGPGDPYLLPTAAVAATLKSHGVRALNLGPNTPLDAMAAAARHHQARLVWLSISAPASISAMQPQLAAFVDEVVASGARLIIGGRCGDRLKIPTSPFIFRGSSMTQLAAFAQGVLASSTSA